ncbi:MAG: hypothetical protein H5T69_15340, partial [Chloroflexi bacterium]|nr:hypothetical protein [Chloroflexota bacterium]
MMSALGISGFHRIGHRAIKLALVVMLVLAGVMLPALDVVAEATWRGEYYNNVNLAGAPTLIREDASINFDWGVGSPAAGIGNDGFSVRWTSFQYFDAGDYTFIATSDDGVRLWVDDQLIIDQWHDHPATTYTGVKSLSTGFHSLRLEFYENMGQALIRLAWQLGGGVPPAGVWRGEYYNNTWLGGPPALVRNDAQINFDWGSGAPAPGILADNFSVRWTQNINFPSSGNWTFYATVDDGVRLWVDGAPVIDRWYPQSRTTHSGTVYLAAGVHQVRVEYFEQLGVALCSVNWTLGGGPAAFEIIVDDRDPNFVWGGPTSGWFGRNTGFRNHLFWTWNSRTELHNWGKWFPHLPQAGNWEVFVYIASRYFGSKSARYRVFHSGVWDDRVVNQNIYYDKWVSLGTFFFS